MPFTLLNRAASTTVLAGLLASLAPAAHAQFGGTVAWQSDARDRGISYSDGRPQAQLTLSYDGSAGWYGGGLLTRARFDSQRNSNLLAAYLGRVATLTPGLDAEAGLRFNHYPSITRYDYAEVYAGLLGEGWSARLNYANDYYGSGQRSVYAEFNSHWPLRRTLSAQLHLGALAGRGDAVYDDGHGKSRLDARLGLAWQVEAVELQLSWSTVSTGGPYTWVSERRRQAVVLGLSMGF